MESTSKRRPASKPKHHPFLNPKEVLIVLMGFIDMTEARKKIHLAECIDSLRQLLGETISLWDLIAGRIPGRKAEEIERFWIMKNNEVFAERRKLKKKEKSKISP
ncbi:hypothetical protein CUMW_090380 [Citrus unshiu]|nr:hypothetical protein CUMW_090380 [Citrus unshiu]